MAIKPLVVLLRRQCNARRKRPFLVEPPAAPSVGARRIHCMTLGTTTTTHGVPAMVLSQQSAPLDNRPTIPSTRPAAATIQKRRGPVPARRIQAIFLGSTPRLSLHEASTMRLTASPLIFQTTVIYDQRVVPRLPCQRHSLHQ